MATRRRFEGIFYGGDGRVVLRVCTKIEERMKVERRRSVWYARAYLNIMASKSNI